MWWGGHTFGLLQPTMAMLRASSHVVAGCPRRSVSMVSVARPQRSACLKPLRAYAAVGELTDAERATLATKLGFNHIGKDLPADVTLTDIIKTLPPEVFEIDQMRAFSAVLISVASLAVSLFLVHIAPWYLLPLAWAFAGTAVTGWFVVGHDCAHKSFSKNTLLEDIVGTLAFAPLLYPYEPWRIKHNVHHAHTNKLVEDTAWHPLPEEDLAKLTGVAGGVARLFLGSPLKLWASVGHWAIWHFNPNKYTERQRPRVIVSLLAVAAFALVALPALVHYAGWWGLVKYWLMPWLGYHFWMSTFTVIHHTAPHIPFKPASEWNAAAAQLTGTVHCNFPGWVDFLCHDIAWHIPHHVASNIPWYNLRKATASLRENWGEYLTEGTFNWRIIKNCLITCNVYDKELNYKPFDFAKEEKFFAFQRAALPNSM